MQNEKLHVSVHPLERFTCLAYSKEGPYTLPDLRYKLWSSKNKESETLPPCRATLVPHIQRTDFVSRIHKSYNQTHPVLPALTESGWKRNEKTGFLLPVHCLVPPVPLAMLELIKCGCVGDCSSMQCSCHKNMLKCTSLCKCKLEKCTNQ